LPPVYALALACVLNTSTCQSGYFVLDNRTLEDCQDVVMPQIDSFRTLRRDKSVVKWRAQGCTLKAPQDRKFMGMI